MKMQQKYEMFHDDSDEFQCLSDDGFYWFFMVNLDGKEISAMNICCKPDATLFTSWSELLPRGKNYIQERGGIRLNIHEHHERFIPDFKKL